MEDKTKALAIERECLMLGATSDLEVISRDGGLPNDTTLLLGRNSLPSTVWRRAPTRPRPNCNPAASLSPNPNSNSNLRPHLQPNPNLQPQPHPHLHPNLQPHLSPSPVGDAVRSAQCQLELRPDGAQPNQGRAPREWARYPHPLLLRCLPWWRLCQQRTKGQPRGGELRGGWRRRRQLRQRRKLRREL